MNLKGQERVKEVLERIQGRDRVPNALLFFGPPGVGKTVASLDFARGILCLSSLPWGCGECASCRHMDRITKTILSEEWDEISLYQEEEGKGVFLYLMGDHPDFVFVPPHGSSVKIDQIRAVREFAYSKPALSKRKVVVIDRSDLMTRESSNALLKVLEEPPAGTHFILVAETKENLPPTVVSRTQQVEFPPLDRETFTQLVDDPDLYEISGGSVTVAKLIKERSDVLNLVDEFLSFDPLKVYDTAKKLEDTDSKGRDLFFFFLEDRVYRMFREGKLSYDDLEVVMRRIAEIREGLPKGIRVDLALYTLYTLMEVRYHELHKG